MTNSYYIKHRYLAWQRNRSKDNSWLIGLLLFFIGFQVCQGIYNAFPDLVAALMARRPELSEQSASLIIYSGLLLSSFLMLLTFSPPQVHDLPYRIWRTRPRDIATGYLLLAPISWVNIVAIAFMTPALLRMQQYEPFIFWKFLLLWHAIYFISIAIHLVANKTPVRSIAAVLVSGLSGWLFFFASEPPVVGIGSALALLALALSLAYWQCIRYLRRRDIFQSEGTKKSIWDSLSFREGLMQLEWALITRNKRTRSNFIAGVLALPVIFYTFPATGEQTAFLPLIVLGVLVTAFPMLQHGIYMIGWEGSYFDLLISRVTMKEFFEFKYRFFVMSSLAMFGICALMFFWSPMLFLPMLAALTYNIGVNTYIVLQGSLSNTVKLDLDQKTIFNTQAINGTLIINSLLLVLVPVIVFAIAKSFLGEEGASLVLIGIGLVGIVFRRPALNQIVLQAQRKKYALAKGFRS